MLDVQSVTNNTETSYMFKKNPNNMLDLLKDTQNSTFLIVQCFAKSRNAMLGSGGREFPRKLAADIK